MSIGETAYMQNECGNYAKGERKIGEFAGEPVFACANIDKHIFDGRDGCTNCMNWSYDDKSMNVEASKARSQRAGLGDLASGEGLDLI
jgi:hypothetical protein